MGVFDFLVSNRWVFAIWLLPLSLLYDIFWSMRRNYVIWKGSAPGKHEERVKYVQKQVRDWQTLGNGRKMCTARPQWMSISQQFLKYKENSYQVKVDLMDILKVDEERMVVHVEPMVSIQRLIQRLIPLGYTVPIVPELGDLTVGGLVMGGGIESTSHKYGLWQHICTRYELVTADGSLIEATKDNEHSDLFYVIPWSYGTFGFLVGMDIKIIPFKPYVKLVYQPTYNLDEAMKVFHNETLKDEREGLLDNDSVEGIMFSKNKSVIMTGTFVDDYEPSKLNRLGLWFKPWFYRHVETFLENGKGVEYIPTLDFYFRHNKPFFWLTHIWVPFGHHPIFRYLLGWMLPYNYGLMKLISSSAPTAKDIMVVQDFGIPSKYLKKAVEFFDKTVGIYPLWLCPARALDTGPVKSMKDDDPIHIDIGIYGPCMKKNYNKLEAHKAMEHFALKHNGYMGLYAEVFLTYDEFNQMFDGETYWKVRRSLPLTEEAFPETYDKISKIGRS